MKKLRIQNYKCFENSEIDFRGITILAGANSVGKSSVVQSILLSRICLQELQKKGENLKTWQKDMKISGAKSLLSNKAVPISLNGPFWMNLGNVQEVLNRNAIQNNIHLAFESNNGQSFLEFELALPDEEIAYNLLLSEVGFTSVDPKNPLVGDLFPITENEFYYLNAERIGPRLRYEVDDMPYIHAGWQGEYAVQLLGENKREEITESKCFDKEQVRHLLHQSRLWLNFITPGTTVDDTQLYAGIKAADILFSGSRPTNVGFGLSYVLPIIVNGLVAKKGAIFIIENPEAHLHPSGQSNIGKFLAKIAAAGVKVIIETHSEHVINGIRLAALEGKIPFEEIQINFFDRDSSNNIKISSIQLTEKSDLTEWPKGFFDQQEQDLANIFRLKRQLKP